MRVPHLSTALLLAALGISCGDESNDESDNTGILSAANTGGTDAMDSGGPAGPDTRPGSGTDSGSGDGGTGSETESGADPETCPGVDGSTLPLTPGDHLGLEIEFDGAARSFGLQVPAGYDTTACNPALLFLHGTHPGPTERDVQATYMGGSGWRAVADQHGFLVAYPVGTIYAPMNAYGFYTPTQQDQIDHHRWIDTVRDKLIAEGAVDPNRVYIMGFSTGGFAAGEALVLTGEKYAAYGVHGAGAHPNLTYNVPPDGRGVYIFIGTGDTAHFDFTQTMVNELRGAGWLDGVDLVYNERSGWGHQYDSSLNTEQWAFFSQFSMAHAGPGDLEFIAPEAPPANTRAEIPIDVVPLGPAVLQYEASAGGAG